jgi:hypothetical protein
MPQSMTRSLVLLIAAIVAVISFDTREASATALRVPITVAIHEPLDAVVDRFDVLYVTTDSSIARFDLRDGGAALAPIDAAGARPRTLALDPQGCRLAIADAQVTDRQGVWVLEALDQSVPRHFPFEPDPWGGYYGSYSVIWANEDQVLTSSLYSGSGWGPIRETTLSTGDVRAIGERRQNTMLTRARDGTYWFAAEANTSSGPVTAFRRDTHAAGDTERTEWFTFELAVSNDESVVVVPTYAGAFVLDHADGQLVARAARLGTYASTGPVGFAFAPHTTRSFAAVYGHYESQARGIYVYEDYSFDTPELMDAQAFGWTGNWALREGRMQVSADGRWLAVTRDEEVLVYDVRDLAADPDAVFTDGAECSSIRG